MVLAEAGLLGLGALAAGVPLGFAAAAGLVAILTVTGLAPSEFALHLSWLFALLGAIAALVIPPVAAGAASRRAARARPAEALRAASAARQAITAGAPDTGRDMPGRCGDTDSALSATPGQTGALVAPMLPYLLAAANALVLDAGSVLMDVGLRS